MIMAANGKEYFVYLFKTLLLFTSNCHYFSIFEILNQILIIVAIAFGLLLNKTSRFCFTHVS